MKSLMHLMFSARNCHCLDLVSYHISCTGRGGGGACGDNIDTLERTLRKWAETATPPASSLISGVSSQELICCFNNPVGQRSLNVCFIVEL